MELKTLWLGMLISMAAFAVKTGLGWAYMWSKCPPGRKMVASLILFGLYGALFFALSRLIVKLDLLSHYDLLKPLWEKGVTMHWLMAGLLLLWGLALMKAKSGACEIQTGSRAWLALVIPCPVCLSVILMSAAGLALYFPDHSGRALAGLFVAFVLLAVIGGLAMIFGKRQDVEAMEPTLGLAMMLMATYFMVSTLVMPQFSDISKVYRLAAYAGEQSGPDPATVRLTISAITVLLGLGFLITKRRYRRNRLPVISRR